MTYNKKGENEKSNYYQQPKESNINYGGSHLFGFQHVE